MVALAAFTTSIQPLLPPSPLSSPQQVPCTLPLRPCRRPRSLWLSTAAPKYPPNPTPLFSPGELLNSRYRVVGPLGSGGYSTTWSAIDTKAEDEDESEVVLKVLSLKTPSRMGTWKALEMLEREAGVLKSLHHKGVPKYGGWFEVDSVGDRLFVLVQRRAKGRNLREWVEMGWRFGSREIEAVASGLLEVLEYLEGLRPRVVHRDVKPDNVVVEMSERSCRRGDHKEIGIRVNLVDFGGVNAAGANVASTVVGTFGYMAPEQLRGVVDSRSDLYGAGATILYMLTGRRPADLPQKRLMIDLEQIFVDEERRRLGSVYTLIQGLLEPALEDRVPSASAALKLLAGSDKELERDVKKRGLYVSQGEMEVVDKVRIPARRTRGGVLKWGERKRRIISKPKGSRVVIQQDRGCRQLSVNILARGLSEESVSTGAFTIAWNGLVGLWTFGALTAGGSIAMSLFSLPFWFVGTKLVHRLADELGGHTELVISKGEKKNQQSYFLLRRFRPFWRDKVVEGDTRDLSGIQIKCWAVAQGDRKFELQLTEGVRVHHFGQDLQIEELEYVAAAVNNFLWS